MSLTGTSVAARSNEAYERLRNLIVRGRLAPGARLSEQVVSERLGMSRTPVRSALQRLQQEGYVTVNAVGRCSVAPLTRDDAVELFELVAELEGLAGRRAARLPAGRRAEVVAELERLNAELADLPRMDLNARFENDSAFHQVYVDAAPGPRLRALHGFAKPQAERYIRVYINLLAGAGGASNREHAAIAAAIAAGDPDEAQLAVQTNWRNAAMRLSDVIDEMGGRGDWFVGGVEAGAGNG